jgi:hypothetical protein
MIGGPVGPRSDIASKRGFFVSLKIGEAKRGLSDVMPGDLDKNSFKSKDQDFGS